MKVRVPGAGASSLGALAVIANHRDALHGQVPGKLISRALG